jgi:hypothetical protein
LSTAVVVALAHEAPEALVLADRGERDQGHGDHPVADRGVQQVLVAVVGGPGIRRSNRSRKARK